MTNNKNTRTYTIETWNPLALEEDEKFIKVLEITIEQPDGVKYSNIQWDSKTGLVTANINGSEKREAIPYTGRGLGKIAPGPFRTSGVAVMNYHYWYN